jgi:hypothetical protein
VTGQQPLLCSPAALSRRTFHIQLLHAMAGVSWVHWNTAQWKASVLHLLSRPVLLPHRTPS